MQNMKKLMDLPMRLGRVAEELHRAWEWDPEKLYLRKSRDGRVALTKEGSVSCMVRTGLAVEYHILGSKMELASSKHEDDDDDNADN
jgi:hypothetical protein